MKSGTMTTIGLAGGLTGAGLALLPPEAPWWAHFALIILNILIPVYLGKTHPGTEN